MLTTTTRDIYDYPIPELDYDCNMYWSGIYRGKVYAYSHVQIVKDTAHLHLYCQSWGHNVLREMIADYGQMKRILRGYGVTKIVATHPIEGQDKWGKFISLLGFGHIVPYASGVMSAMCI